MVTWQMQVAILNASRCRLAAIIRITKWESITTESTVNKFCVVSKKKQQCSILLSTPFLGGS